MTPFQDAYHALELEFHMSILFLGVNYDLPLANDRRYTHILGTKSLIFRAIMFSCVLSSTFCAFCQLWDCANAQTAGLLDT